MLIINSAFIYLFNPVIPGFGNGSNILMDSATRISHTRIVLSLDELANIQPPHINNDVTVPELNFSTINNYHWILYFEKKISHLQNQFNGNGTPVCPTKSLNVVPDEQSVIHIRRPTPETNKLECVKWSSTNRTTRTASFIFIFILPDPTNLSYLSYFAITVISEFE